LYVCYLTQQTRHKQIREDLYRWSDYAKIHAGVY